MDQNAFLTRIRQRLSGDDRSSGSSRTGTWAQDPGESPGGEGLRPTSAPQGAGDAERFLQEWIEVGGQGQQLVREVLGPAIVELLGAQQARSLIIWGNSADPVMRELRDALDQQPLEVFSWNNEKPQEGREFAARADVGIVSASAAVATTGTVMLEGAPGKGRAAGLLPPTMFVVVRRSVIEPTLRDVLQPLSERRLEGSLPQNVSLVTGPSKSADIGLELVTNVHGPGHVHAFVVTDM